MKTFPAGDAKGAQKVFIQIFIRRPNTTLSHSLMSNKERKDALSHTPAVCKLQGLHDGIGAVTIVL